VFSPPGIARPLASDWAVVRFLSRAWKPEPNSVFTMHRYEQGADYWTMGRLGPDLDVHEINQKKAIKERIKERDRQVRSWATPLGTSLT
jgi:hypothetical protein